jgi:hypothetical protein
MRFLLTENKVKIPKHFKRLLLNAETIHGKRFQESMVFITKDIILFYELEKSLNGNYSVVFYCYYFFEPNIYNKYHRKTLNKVYDNLTGKRGLIGSRFLEHVFISNLRGHFVTDHNCEMLYLSCCSTKSYTLSQIKKMKKEKTYDDILSLMQDEILKFTLESKDKFINKLFDYN